MRDGNKLKIPNESNYFFALNRKEFLDNLEIQNTFLSV